MIQRKLSSLNSDLEAHRNDAEAEFEQYYGSFDPCTEPLLLKLDDMLCESGDVSSYELKTRMYELLSEACPVHLFRHSDFFFEISSGRPRESWGGLQSPVGSFLHRGERGGWIREYAQTIQKDRDEYFFHGWDPVGLDHHCPGYDEILHLGLNGIIAQAETMLEDCQDKKKREFYHCVIRANRSLKRLAERFAEEAERARVRFAVFLHSAEYPRWIRMRFRAS